MIRLLKTGYYRLTRTKHSTRILELAGIGTFAWIDAGEIGDILVLTKQYRKPGDFIFGKYRLYEVKDEKELIDTTHLELFTGLGSWTGYLLPTGLPNPQHIRSRIIATGEIITRSKKPVLNRPQLTL